LPNDTSSADTELEVSINNAHLLTNLAKAVQDKVMNNVKAGQKGSAEKRPVLLDEDRWLFAYEE
jgi:hypothetical protein